jgi:predicted transcriptional regulator
MKTEEKMLIVPDFMVVMLAIKDNPGMNISEIHYKSQITYSHLHLIKKMLIRKNWITVQKELQSHIPSLTLQGEDIVVNIISLLTSMGISKEEVYAYKLSEKRTGVKNDSERRKIPEEVFVSTEDAPNGDSEIDVSKDTDKQEDS